MCISLRLGSMNIESSMDTHVGATEAKFPANPVASASQECTSPETGSEGNEAWPEGHIGIVKLVILGICANLTNLIIGFDFNVAAVVFNGLALDLHIAEKDLQWIFNSMTLALVRFYYSDAPHHRIKSLIYCRLFPQGCTTLISGRIADILGADFPYGLPFVHVYLLLIIVRCY
jgi:hypothetical protein